jgi:hypothetical protein
MRSGTCLMQPMQECADSVGRGSPAVPEPQLTNWRGVLAIPRTRGGRCSVSA